MKKTVSVLAAILALGLFMAGCSKKDEGMGEPHDAMENSGGEMNNNAAGQSMEAPAEAPPAETPPAEPAPTEGGQQ